ncbi:hypothetical protein GE21DRAFT_8454 [Neurospora crassa]|uniref:Uncharacterized protein n=1 Tax=Neurospora crassa (strain ATCC 24698 / 74-OR23-1A / CBS 708.71 / DSM 1257 / FGSC 987) TaxID=367110 RepID=Q7RZ01_NEUCR|nr:hypothetical protein NCU07228 [Neurospora crassa OR74A]EAA28217.1 hypothetical protein NCU07228 [Neurospora crassa OR74A]KHE85741.1 hypothetical protein GE21DRAFT_8454 [Neurospora crassa]|eukprot:XP_957453.1 hypothetical protein NCU07228 [Neurospora crassa OR74A]
MATNKNYKEALNQLRVAWWNEEAKMAKDFANAADQEAWLKHFHECLASIKQGPPSPPPFKAHTSSPEDTGVGPHTPPVVRKSCGVEVDDDDTTGSRVVKIFEYEKLVESSKEKDKDAEVDVEYWITRPTALLVEVPGTELSRVHIGIKGPGKIYAEKAVAVVESDTTHSEFVENVTKGAVKN